MQRDRALGPALVIFGVILIFVLAVARDDLIIGIIVGLPMIIAGILMFMRARQGET